MKVLLVAATKEEIGPSIQFLQDHNIPYIITGVGMTATAYAIGKAIAVEKPELILNVGIAGSFDKNLPLGSLLQVDTDYIAELGAQDDKQFITIDNLGFGKQKFSAVNPNKIIVSLPTVQAITVNTVHGNEQSIANVKSLFPDVTLESMEGAAVFYVSELENIPSLQIRAISNYVEKRNRDTWNIPLAIKNLNIWIQNNLTSFL